MRPANTPHLCSIGLAFGVLLLSACASATPDPAIPDPPPFTLSEAEVVRVPGPLTTTPDPRATPGPRVLCVTAHPDDEIAFAGLVYKTVTHLGGTVDLCVLTDGQGGFKYTTLAEPLLGLDLTDESTGRRELPALRRAELLRGAAWLGFRSITFVDQPDHRYTQDVDEVLAPDAGVWDLPRMRRVLAQQLDAEPYDALLVLTPSPTTHGHHQAAALLAAEAAQARPEAERPAVLCVWGERDEDASRTFEVLPERPLAQVLPGERYVFDRRQRFGHRERLDYSIVANWAIAEHKSQGTMQLLAGRQDREVYRPLAVTPRTRLPFLADWFARLAEPQFEAREYDASAGTNAARTGAR